MTSCHVVVVGRDGRRGIATGRPVQHLGREVGEGGGWRGARSAQEGRVGGVTSSSCNKRVRS